MYVPPSGSRPEPTTRIGAVLPAGPVARTVWPFMTENDVVASIGPEYANAIVTVPSPTGAHVTPVASGRVSAE